MNSSGKKKEQHVIDPNPCLVPCFVFISSPTLYSCCLPILTSAWKQNVTAVDTWLQIHLIMEPKYSRQHLKWHSIRSAWGHIFSSLEGSDASLIQRKKLQNRLQMVTCSAWLHLHYRRGMQVMKIKSCNLLHRYTQCNHTQTGTTAWGGKLQGNSCKCYLIGSLLWGMPAS